MRHDATRRDTKRCNVAQLFGKQSFEILFQSTLSGPFGAPFSIPWESILRPFFGPIRDPSWSPENDLKMGGPADVAHATR